MRLEALLPGDTFDPRVPEAIVAAGLHLLPVPARVGGLGATMREAAEVLAALGARDGSTTLGFAMHVHSVGSIAESAAWPEALRDRLYRSIIAEGALLNNASTEEGGGSPARGAIPGTIARPDAQAGAQGAAGSAGATAVAGWRLSGEKTWTTWLPALRYALVSARIEDGAEGGGRDAPPVVGTFLVDLECDGVDRRPGFDALGMRGSASGRLVLDDVRVPGDALVSRRLAGDPDPRGAAPGAWFAMAVAATYLGVGEGVRERVARWAAERRPGDGSTAVADLPTVQLRLGRLDAALRTARIV
ncbi:MAG TPA: acyl-CoA dehydrogenase family protein, partial [Frankiaceae bacterium]|nr:acyl-CoA dehydrogenase family protein [Frankiaceae bacterium]